MQTTSKQKRYKHNPTKTEINGIEVELSEDGKIRLTQRGMEDGEATEDVIESTAQLVTKLHKLLYATRRVVYVDVPSKE